VIEAIAAELFQNKASLRAKQAGDPVERHIETLDVVKRIARDCRLERSGVLKFFKRGAAEDRSVGSVGVNGEDAVADAVHRARQFAGAAADFEHARREWGKGG
jgi:hypothetical protein